MARNLRIGVIGIGRIGQSHASVVHEMENVHAIIADADAERARSFAEELGASSVEDVDELFERELDAVVIASPTDTHPELIRRGVEAGLTVFCEKPVSTDLRAAIAIGREVEAVGGVVQMGFQRRFDQGYRRVRDAIRSGELGRIHTMRTVNWDPKPPSRDFIPESGGIFRDTSTHDIDAICWATGEQVLEVFAMGSNGAHDYLEDLDDYDSAVAVVRLTGDIIATVSLGRHNLPGYDARLEANGTQKTLCAGLGIHTTVLPADASSTLTSKGGPEDFYARFVPAFRAELEAFVELVRGGENPAPLDEAVEAAIAVEALVRSAREHRPVQVAEIRDAYGVGRQPEHQPEHQPESHA